MDLKPYLTESEIRRNELIDAVLTAARMFENRQIRPSLLSRMLSELALLAQDLE
jgi:hypothetical protein